MKRIYKEIQNQKMIDEEKLNNIRIEQEKKREEIQELLRQSRKDEEQLKSIADLNSNNYNIVNSNLNSYDYHDIGVKNYYMDYLKQIQIRNEVINKTSFETEKNKIHKIDITDNNNCINTMKINNKNLFNKICDFKKIKKENYSCTDLNNINLYNNYLDDENKIKNYTNAYNEINTSFKNEFNLNNRNEEDQNNSKYNLNSYFKINVKNKNTNNKKFDLKS